jgi:hypothetical protein
MCRGSGRGESGFVDRLTTDALTRLGLTLGLWLRLRRGERVFDRCVCGCSAFDTGTAWIGRRLLRFLFLDTALRAWLRTPALELALQARFSFRCRIVFRSLRFVEVPAKRIRSIE